MFKNKSLFLVGALLLLSLSCTHKGPDEPDSSATVSLTTARALCIKACGGNSDYAAAVRNGCMDGCERAVNSYPYAGETFSNWEVCKEKVNLSLGHGLNKNLDECNNSTDNIYRQQGCKDAARAFYRALNPTEVCKPVDPGYIPEGFVVMPPAQ